LISDVNIGLYVYENGIIAEESIDLDTDNDSQRTQLFRIVAQAVEL